MEMFDCSHMTIRRDIALLEQEGRAYSVTGGVRIASQLHSEHNHQLRAFVELPQKQAMANKDGRARIKVRNKGLNIIAAQVTLPMPKDVPVDKQSLISSLTFIDEPHHE